MADTMPTIWPADPHTLAKHAILQRYLQAWFPILTRQASALARRCSGATAREILFIDGFAGPGEYTNGKEGSPLIALKAALNHDVSFPIPVRMLFIEERKDRFDHLQRLLAPHLARLNQSSNIRAVDPRPGDCDSVLNTLLDDCERKGIAIGPALAFLDQFGYGSVSMALISRILRFGQCEAFTYLDYKDMNRWISDPTKASAFTRAYGGQEWQGAVKLPERERRKFLLDQYKAQGLRSTTCPNSIKPGGSGKKARISAAFTRAITESGNRVRSAGHPAVGPLDRNSGGPPLYAADKPRKTGARGIVPITDDGPGKF